MTEIDLLKRVRADEPDADPLVLARARQRLLTPPPVRGRAPRLRLLIAGGLALILTGAFLAKDMVSHDGSPVPGTVADAGTFLADAAAKSEANPDAPVPPGHFRLVTTRQRFVHRFGPRKQHLATSQLVVESWIPPSQNSRYVERAQWYTKVSFETPGARAAARKFAPFLLSRPKPEVYRVNCAGLRLDGGFEPKYLKRPCTPGWSFPTTEFLARQPRDPDALLAVLRKHTPPVGRPESFSEKSRAKHTPPDERAFQRIENVLRSGIVPADLRAALYQAARKIPGIKLVGDVVTLDGRSGVAIGYTNSYGQRSDLIIDPSTGRSIGSRMIDPGYGLPPDDVGSVDSFTSRITAERPPVR